MYRQVQTHRFFVSTALQRGGRSFTLDPEETKHAVSVLRLKEGEIVELCDGQGGHSAGLIESINRKEKLMSVVCEGDPVFLPRPRPEIVLCVGCGGLKGGRGDWLVEKSAELGASRLLPLLCERSPTLGKGETGRLERWKRISIAAMKQSMRSYLMTIESARHITDMNCHTWTDSMLLLAVNGGEDLTSALHRSQSGISACDWEQIVIFIGPEGDFTEAEKRALIRDGCIPVSLGTHRLRVETAAIGLLSFEPDCFESVAVERFQYIAAVCDSRVNAPRFSVARVFYASRRCSQVHRICVILPQTVEEAGSSNGTKYVYHLNKYK